MKKIAQILFLKTLVLAIVLTASMPVTQSYAGEFAGGDDGRRAKSAAVPDGVAGVQRRIQRMSYNKGLAYNVPQNQMIGSYYPTWAALPERSFSPAQVPVEQLSHIIVAYGAICGRNVAAYQQGAQIMNACLNPNDNQGNGRNELGWYYLPDFTRSLQKNEAVLIDNPDLYFNQEITTPQQRYRGLLPAMIDWKNRNPNLKVYWAIGGWNYSGPFYEMAASPANRATFINSIRFWLSQPVMHFVDGISIDWEAPGGGAADGGLGNPSSDGRNLVSLVSEMRRALEELGRERNREYELAVSLAVGRQKLINFRHSATISEVLGNIDRLGLLSYDFFGTWGKTIGFNTAVTAPESENPILSVTEVLNILTRNHGVSDLRKISVGVPFYGRSHGRVQVSDPARLPGAPKSGGVEGYTVEPGVISYFDLFQNYLGESGRGINGWEPYYYPEYEAGLLWKRATGEVISYAPPRTMKAVVELVRTRGMGGIFSWGIDDDNGKLLGAIHDAYGHIPGAPVPRGAQKRWIYAPLCPERELAARAAAGTDLRGLTFTVADSVYQIENSVTTCPKPDDQTPPPGWKLLGTVETFNLPDQKRP